MSLMDPPILSNEDFANGMKDGNENVYRLLLYEFGPRLRARLYKIFGRVSEDDFNEALARAIFYLCEHPEKYDPGQAPPLAYFYLIVRQRYINILRENSKMLLMALDKLVGCTLQKNPEATISEEAQLMIKLIKQEIEALPNEEQAIFWASQLGGNWPTDLAPELGKSPRALSVKLVRIKEKLRKNVTAKLNGKLDHGGCDE